MRSIIRYLAFTIFLPPGWRRGRPGTGGRPRDVPRSPHLRVVNPAALAFLAGGPGNENDQAFHFPALLPIRGRRSGQFHPGDDEKIFKDGLVFSEEGEELFRSAEGDRGFQGISDAPALPGRFQEFRDFSPDLQEEFETFFEFRVEILGFHLRKEGEVDAFSPSFGFPGYIPRLLRGEGENGGHEAHNAVQDLEEGRLGRAALRRKKRARCRADP